jgi:hypothetical protein
MSPRLTPAVGLSPCPFCCGPPVPHCRRLDEPRGPVDKRAPFSEEGDYCEAYVFCHECGAQGPTATGDGMGGALVFDAVELATLELEAVTLWNERNARHLDLFESGTRDGLNQYPRDHAAEDTSRALRKAAPAMLAKLESMAGECAECEGGVCTVYDGTPKTRRTFPCADCADLRAVISQAKGAP